MNKSAYAKKKSSSSQNNLGRTAPKTTNQKKKSNTNLDTKELFKEEKMSNGNYTQFSSKIFKGNAYVEKFISEVNSDKYSFKCMKCRNDKGKLGKILLVNSLKKHITSAEHKSNTPIEETEKYEELIKLFNEETHGKKIENEETNQEEKNIKDYLNFISFLMSQRLSFCQIEAFGKFLQKAYKDKKLKFLVDCNFDKKLLSKIAQNCFKVLIEDQIKEKLSNNPYSLIIDNSTFCNSNLCALKVKFLEKEWHEELQTHITSVKNQIIALSDLKESSTGQTLKDIVESRLFTNDDIKKNMIGLAHDNGSSLVGENIGLASLLKKENNPFFDLRDPCHGLNLVLKNSIKILPSNLLSFVQSISNHFSSPQRKAMLKRIQEENGHDTLYPKTLALTRWLSLGDCLDRLLQIWGSLTDYFGVLCSNKKGKTKKKEKSKSNVNKETIQKIKSSDLNTLLNDQIFHLKILLLDYIVSSLNRYNIKFQSQTMSISELKKNMYESYFSILEIALKPSQADYNLNHFLDQDWEDSDVQNEKFLSSSEFINSLSNLSSKYDILNEVNQEAKEEFANIFLQFIGKILNLFKDYLPFQDKLVEIFDFVELKDPLSVFKEKLSIFCEFFNLLDEEDKPKLKEELIKLKNIKVNYYQESSTNTLHMWDRLKSQEGLNLIPKLIFFAESLPTTSAGLEQSFSQIKLFKSEIRNRMTEATLEGLILISQELAENKYLNVDEKMIKLFQEVKSNFHQKKKVIKNVKVVRDDQSSSDINRQENNLVIQEIQTQKTGVIQEDEDLDENIFDDDNLYPVQKKVKTEIIS